MSGRYEATLVWKFSQLTRSATCSLPAARSSAAGNRLQPPAGKSCITDQWEQLGFGPFERDFSPGITAADVTQISDTTKQCIHFYSKELAMFIWTCLLSLKKK